MDTTLKYPAHVIPLSVSVTPQAAWDLTAQIRTPGNKLKLKLCLFVVFVLKPWRDRWHRATDGLMTAPDQTAKKQKRRGGVWGGRGGEGVAAQSRYILKPLFGDKLAFLLLNSRVRLIILVWLTPTSRPEAKQGVIDYQCSGTIPPNLRAKCLSDIVVYCCLRDRRNSEAIKFEVSTTTWLREPIWV